MAADQAQARDGHVERALRALGEAGPLRGWHRSARWY